MAEGETYMHIGEVAELVGLSHRTIHYYEEVGLAVPVGRSNGGFRLYDHDVVERLRAITYMKPLGLSLEQMAAFFEAERVLSDPSTDHDDRHAALGVMHDITTHTHEQARRLRRDLHRAGEFAQRLDALSFGMADLATTGLAYQSPNED